MAEGYKIRLADGSEIGPMDRESVRAWYQQGLATRETPVLPPGSKRWITLAEAVELKDLRSPAQRNNTAAVRTTRTTSVAAAPPPTTSFEVEEAQTWRTRLAAALFAALALSAAFLALWPERWLPALDATPWLIIALAFVILAALLHRGWEVGRKIARVVVFLAGLGGFALLGLLVAQGLRGPPLYVVLSAMVLTGGFFALLAGGFLSWQRFGLAALTLLVGLGGIINFGLVPGNPLTDEILAWASPERRFADESLGVTLELPPAWVALRSDQTIVSLPSEARLAFGNARREGLGFLEVESAPKGVLSLEDYLERFLKERKKEHPSLEETERSDISLSGVNGRKVLSAREEDGRRMVELTAVSRDGWTYVALAAWMPASASTAASRELEALPARLSLSGVLAGQLQDAISTTTREVPYLTGTAAEMLLSQSAALALDPEIAFRRAYRLASTGLTSLPPGEFSELGQINTAVYDTLPRKNRVELAAYFDRVRAGEETSPTEDREMLRLMRGAVLKLPPARLTRLQQIYEKAIRVAVSRD